MQGGSIYLEIDQLIFDVAMSTAEEPTLDMYSAYDSAPIGIDRKPNNVELSCCLRVLVSSRFSSIYFLLM